MERIRELVHADAAHKNGYIGSGITVAVMDTGERVIIMSKSL